MYPPEQLREIYLRLAEAFPEEAIERTRAAETKKGYDTTGIKYQYVVNRLNDVLGVGGFRVSREFGLRDKQTRNGYPMVEATCDLTVQLGHWEGGEFIPFAEATGTGGHTASSEADAKKGAFTNGFKKTVAFFGVGRQAYEGTLDDDNVPGGPGLPAEPARRTGGQSATWQSRTDEQSETPRNEHKSGNGRVTATQLSKMRELVAELGGEWRDYRQHIKEKHGVNVEYADRKLASSLISGLVASARKRRGNGTGARVS